jgi:AcrR family transcriptional regulator
MSAKQRGERRHPTRELLLACAQTLLCDHSPTEITTEMILRHSGVSRGSLYHHFEDLSHLLETALVRSFSAVVDENIQVLSELLATTRDAAGFHSAINDFNSFAQASERTSFRLDRVRLLGFAVNNPRMAAKLAVEQSRLTNAYADLIKTAQERGWISTDGDPYVIAVFIQAFTIGRVVDDVSETAMDLSAWKSLIMKVAASVLGTQPDADQTSLK